MSIPPGWYPDPAEPETQKFWDGEQWTDPPSSRTQPLGTPTQNTITESAKPVPIGVENSAETGAAPETGTALRLASHGSRLAARMIDIGVLFLLNLAVNGWLLIQLIDEIAPVVARVGRSSANGAFQIAEFSGRAEKLVLAITVISVALWLAYEVPSLLHRGQTLGKRMLGIRVIALKGSRGSSSVAAQLGEVSRQSLNSSSLRLGTALRRWAVMGLPALFPLACAMMWLAIDGAWCLKDRPARQCLHDKAASTIVVDV